MSQTQIGREKHQLKICFLSKSKYVRKPKKGARLWNQFFANYIYGDQSNFLINCDMKIYFVIKIINFKKWHLFDQRRQENIEHSSPTLGEIFMTKYFLFYFSLPTEQIMGHSDPYIDLSRKYLQNLF